MMKKSVLIALVSAFFAAGASADVVGGVDANQNPSTFIDLSSGIVAGGAIYTGGGPSSTAAIPFNLSPMKSTVGAWLAAGPSNVNNGGGDAVVSFAPGTTFVSFLWGSPDTYNTLIATTANNVLYTFTSANFPTIVFDGNQDFASYIGFTATGGDAIKSLTFESTNDAFEASNFSLTSPVPEPASWALMCIGLGAIGWGSRRNRRQS